MQKLRPYQREAVESVLDALADGLTRVLYTAPTGSGKTTMFAELTRRLLFKGHRVLILAHRRELIEQAHIRVKQHCDLSEWEIGSEIAEFRAPSLAQVIIGSVQTVMNPGRPQEGWKPTAIITDESQHAAAKLAYGRIYERYGVNEGKCLHIGTTATAKRSDKQSLYAVNVDGSPVMLARKGKPASPADPKESVFEKHVYDFTVMDAIEGGWLVPIIGHTVLTDTDISGVKTRAGDFSQGELTKAVDNARRTMKAISAWEEIAKDRPTVVFCSSVEHAHHAAELWREAGYSAAAVDGETESYERHHIFDEFKAGRVQVLCNMGIATEGTDLPNCACIVHLRPTKSWTLYMQMTGRSSRVLPGVLDAIQDAEPEVRRAAIAASAKPNAIVIDLVDLCKQFEDICTVPNILDLPVKLDLEGHELTEAKKMLDEYEEVRDRVIGECPLTFTRLKVRLEEVNLMRNSGADSVEKWRYTDTGYRFVGVPPGYQCEMTKATDVGSYRMVVKTQGTVLYDKVGHPREEFREYLDRAAVMAQKTITDHRESQPKRSRGTVNKLSEKQVRVLTRHGHTRAEIDTWPYAKAKAVIDRYMKAYLESLNASPQPDRRAAIRERIEQELTESPS